MRVSVFSQRTCNKLVVTLFMGKAYHVDNCERSIGLDTALSEIDPTAWTRRGHPPGHFSGKPLYSRIAATIVAERHVMKLPLLLALVPCAVFAQNFQAMPRLKPILPRLDQPWTKTQALRKPALVGPTIAPAGTPVPSQACSIPLVVIRPRNNDRNMIVAPKPTLSLRCRR
jgi:hypothetical protein